MTVGDVKVLEDLSEKFLVWYSSEVYGLKISKAEDLKKLKPAINVGESEDILCIDFYDKEGKSDYYELGMRDFIDGNHSKASLFYLKSLITELNQNKIFPEELRVELSRKGEILLEIDEEVLI